MSRQVDDTVKPQAKRAPNYSTSATFEPTCSHLLKVAALANNNKYEQAPKKDQPQRKEGNLRYTDGLCTNVSIMHPILTRITSTATEFDSVINAVAKKKNSEMITLFKMHAKRVGIRRFSTLTPYDIAPGMIIFHNGKDNCVFQCILV